MPCWLARTILAALTFGGIGWTVFARFHSDWGEPWTTSFLLRDAQRACDQIAVILMLLTYGLLIDALPDTGHWIILVIMIAMYSLGHGMWHYQGEKMLEQWKQEHAAAIIRQWLREVKYSTIYRMIQHRFTGMSEWSWYAEQAIVDLESRGEIAVIGNTIQLAW